MILLGVNAYHGDASVVAVADGKLVWAVEEERLNRIKHSAGLPKKAFQKAVETLSKDIDVVTISRNPRANILAKISFVLKTHPSLSFLKDRFRVAGHARNIVHALADSEKKNGLRRARGIQVEHHIAHAASAFYPSGFDQAALLTVDGFGDFSSTMFGIGEGNKIKVLKRILFPHSLGILYTAGTQFLGFPKYGDEYKVMGLAGWGEPRFLKEFRQLVRLLPDGTFQLNLDYFLHAKGQMDMTWADGEPVLGAAYSQKWEKLFGPPRHSEEPLTQRHKDIAASLQAIFEEAFFHLLKHLYGLTEIRTLCLAGGCAFNSVANGKIFDQTPFEKVYIQPAAGDAGTALGSALYVLHHQLNHKRNFVMDHAYWGPAFNEEEINYELKILNSELEREGCKIERVEKQEELCRKGAQAVSEEKIVGWFQGRMEWGPRALGNRSILADPRLAQMKDVLNARIKHRENFRPFAPSVLEEKAIEWFEMKSPTSPFMNLVFPVRPDRKDQIPAVTHVDGTARIHTVSKETNPLFWNLIHEFEKLTGIPLLLNTSFNENEPIVCTPEDALHSFLRTQMDVLFLGPYRIERKK